MNCYGFNGSLSISNSEIEIGGYAFYNCSNFKGSLYATNDLSIINEFTFYNCSGFSGQLFLSKPLKQIQRYAFTNCYRFDGSLQIPDTVIEISNSAFSGCIGFSGDLVIPKNIKKIGENAFLSIRFSKIIYNGDSEPECQNLIGLKSDDVVLVNQYYMDESFCFCKIQLNEKYATTSLYKDFLLDKTTPPDAKNISSKHTTDEKNISHKPTPPDAINNTNTSSLNPNLVEKKPINNITPSKNIKNETIIKKSNDLKQNNLFPTQLIIFVIIFLIIIIILEAAIINYQSNTIENYEKNEKSKAIQLNVTRPNKFNYIEMETLNKLKQIECVNLGHNVYRVLYNSSYYAIKELYQSDNFMSTKNFLAEYEFLIHLNHINIIKAYGINFGDEKNQYATILLEYCQNSLDNVIKSNKLKIEFKISIIYEIAIAMKYIHENNIIHRDLKPGNILIDADNHVKICDFGISKYIDTESSSYTHQIGTPIYTAPEILNGNDGEKYDIKADVYSFGKIVSIILLHDEIINDQFNEIIKNCIKDSNERPTFNEIVDSIKNNNFCLIKGLDIDFIHNHLRKIYSDIE